jgi:DNA-binding MarR family transcriptional regulator
MYERKTSPGHLMGWASRLFGRALDRRIRPLGLSVGQVPILLLLAEAGQLSQKDLVKRAAIEQPAMVAILKRMEANGLAERKADASDGRASLFSLTEKATAMLDPLMGALVEGNHHALVGFTADEREQLIAMLYRVIVNIAGGTPEGLIRQ